MPRTIYTNMRRSYKPVAFFVWFFVSCDASCDTFKNTRVILFPRSGSPYNGTLNGCIERIAFDGETVVKVYAMNQRIAQFKKDTVRNMAQLYEIKFQNCKIDGISPGAFRNVPRLTDVTIIGSSIAEIPRDVFNNLVVERLRLSGNKIDIVQEQAFADMANLTHLYMNNNRIEFWNREWFVNSSSIELLDFDYNKIRTFPRKAFIHVPKIKRINLNYNDISNIQPKAFEGLHNLEYLGLAFNRIAQLNDNIFLEKIFIRNLQLNGNRLNFLSPKFFNKTSVEVVTMDGNPLSCPCMHRIMAWLSRQDASLAKTKSCTDNTVPVCAFPEKTSECLEKIDNEINKVFFDGLSASKKALHNYCIRFD